MCPATAHSRTLILLLGAFWIAKGAKFLHADNEYSDKSARMHKLNESSSGALVNRYVSVHMCPLEVGEFQFICVSLKSESFGSYMSA